MRVTEARVANTPPLANLCNTPLSEQDGALLLAGRHNQNELTDILASPPGCTNVTPGISPNTAQPTLIHLQQNISNIANIVRGKKSPSGISFLVTFTM